MILIQRDVLIIQIIYVYMYENIKFCVDEKIFRLDSQYVVYFDALLFV